MAKQNIRNNRKQYRANSPFATSINHHGSVVTAAVIFGVLGFIGLIIAAALGAFRPKGRRIDERQSVEEPA